ncbi:MAG TPA: NBR1-Ig-like domain-containing protein [Anaerolineaceae bacterium]|nr:NBR1-Ig-like domain-containing protein [Anaerolineaceae bacterium]
MKKLSALTFLMLGIALLASCNLPSTTTPTVIGADALRTIAAKTVDAMATQIVLNPTFPPDNSTPVPDTSATPSPNGTSSPSSTPQASQTAGTVTPCDQGVYIRDVTIPDGTLFLPGTAFTKTWEIKNTGTCAWDGTYALVFGNKGDLMGGQLSTPLVASGTVEAGQTVKISVNLVAPGNTGDYKGYWTLRNPAGNVFFGSNNGIWVAIKVVSFGNKFILSDNICNAQWRNSTSDSTALLPCPGKEGDAKGYVFGTSAPKFYTRSDNEPSIVAGPEQVNDGLIVGIFPPVLIPAHTQFRTFVGCGEKMTNCNARVTFTAQVGDGQETTLKDLTQKAQDFNLVTVDLEAASLTGQNVVFRIYVRADGSASQDKIIFLSPMVEPKP